MSERERKSAGIRPRYSELKRLPTVALRQRLQALSVLSPGANPEQLRELASVAIILARRIERDTA